MIERDFKLTRAEHDRVFEQIRQDSMIGVEPVDRPRAVILGGQPGSGKSAALEAAKAEFDDFNVLVINGDEYRYRHPNVKEIQAGGEKDFAKHTDPDAREWTRKLFEHGIEEKANILFEGTMRESNPLGSTLATLIKHGFDVTAKVVAVHHPVSLTAVLFRYEEMKNATGFGRWVDPSAHQAAFDGMPKTLEHIEQNKLAHHVEVVDRQGKTLYQNHLVNGEWEKSPGAREAVETERLRPLSAPEKAAMDNDWRSIYHRMHERVARLEEMEMAGELAEIAYEKSGHTMPAELSVRGNERHLERIHALPGQTYNGQIVSVDDAHVIQRATVGDKQVDVVHDRAKLGATQSSFAIGESARIKYVNQTPVVLGLEKDSPTLSKSMDMGK